MSRRPAESGALGQPDSKRPKGEPSGSSSGALDINAIRAQIAARKAAVEAQVAARQSSGSPAPPPPPAASRPPPNTRPGSSAAGPSAPVGGLDPSIAEKIAAAKARIEAMNAKASNPYLSGGVKAESARPNDRSAGPSSVSGVALHPLLMADGAAGQAGQSDKKNEKKAMRDRYKTMAPKFTSVKANQAVAAAAPPPIAMAAAPILNPYAAVRDAASPVPDEEKIAQRRSKKLHFSAAGKYVKQGDALRNEQKMEALRQRIAEASKKAGLDSEFDTLERSLKRQPPPDVEWWDKAILPEDATYEDLPSAINWITSSEDSLVTHLVQHPIPIPAPGDKKAEARGMMLTKKEQKKMRRQRRQAELEDKRDRQKMGLIPPDPPKVRLANLMKVLTSDAVQDPTKVEAKVRREVAMRAYKHEKDNADRKLTTEQRKEKDYQQMVARERKGLWCAVFKIKYLTNGRHKFKVRETAKTDLLSGVCIFHPNYALVLVEGVDKSIKHYKKLMLNRIDWTEEARPLGADDAGEDGDGDDDEVGRKPSATQESPDSLADNKCELIWEGEVPERTFRFFKARHAESDGKAKEWLTPKWEGMWDVAKRWVWAGEDL